MPIPPLLPPKKEVALALLERSNDRGICVHLDPRRAEVVVPPWFRKEPQLVLQIGLNLPIPIPDLRLDDDAMSCTLSFKGRPFFCVVPWASVFAIVGDDLKGMVWPDDVPSEIAQRDHVRAVETPARKEPWKPEPAGEAKAGSKAKRPRKRPMLAAVADEAPSAPPARPPARSPAPVEPAGVVVARPPAPSPPAPPSRPATGASRPRRELPPYLRIVK